MGTILIFETPYEHEVSKNTYQVLGSIGEEVAKENGLEKHYEGIEVYDRYSIFGVGVGRRDHFSGIIIDEIYDKLKEVNETTERLGICPKYEAEHIDGVRYRIVKIEHLETEKPRSRSRLVTRYVDRYSFDIREYGCLPERMIENLDRLEDTSPVKETLKNVDKEKVVYELLDKFHGYANREGNTVDVFGLDDKNLYKELRTLLKKEKERRTYEIVSSIPGMIPISGDWYINRQYRKLKEELSNKKAIIDSMEAIFVRE